MAYIDEEIKAPQLVFDTEKELFEAVKLFVWMLFEKHMNESYKGKLWGIVPYSVKVAKVAPVLEKFLGPNPYEFTRD